MSHEATTSQTQAEAPKKLTRKDFLSDVDPRWCPGCGTYGVLASLTKVFASLDIPREKYALVSGIGCSSRLPYYVNTYGFHGIHGRAPTIATGLRLARPDLSVWVITGDGDALSIGGNHFLHVMRRNPNLKIILLNNQIYGLTKGQASPTTQLGTKTKSTPFGTVSNPLNPLAMAIAAGATFAARTLDTDLPLLSEVLTAAAKHKGVAFIEVLQNCVIFNDGVFEHLSDKAKKPETTLTLRQGEPLLYGTERNKGLVSRNFYLDAATIGENGVKREDLLVHDAAHPIGDLAYALARFGGPGLPVPFGIFRHIEGPDYEDRFWAKVNHETLEDVLKGENSWVVE